MARFVGDVDTLQDLHLRVVIPALVALVVILGAATAGWLILGALGAALLLTLITIAVVSSWVSARVATVSARKRRPGTRHPDRQACTGDRRFGRARARRSRARTCRRAAVHRRPAGLALARALISHARFLILDEPAAHLDSPLNHRIVVCSIEQTTAE
jgi:ABC-type transport system involved in cytochrome bd biosynthesis fused ATPase/permease subunit